MFCNNHALKGKKCHVQSHEGGMCLNNTKELELCDSRRRKEMPDPPHSCLEFTRNRNSCTGQGKTPLACYLSDAQRKDKINLVCVSVCICVCVPRYTHLCVCQTVL